MASRKKKSSKKQNQKHAQGVLVIAFLAVAVLAVGLVIAGPPPGKGGGGGGAKAECADRVDNDGDGLTDLSDSGCSGKKDNDESNCGDNVCEGGETSQSCSADCGVPAECSDGVDNDGDGFVDLSDAGCNSSSDNDESNCGDNVCEGGETSATCSADCGVPAECSDGVDNDGDGFVDLSDAGCNSSSDNDESNCGDGVCEGLESSLSCTSDCGFPDSCSDTDGGFVPSVQGTTSGHAGGSPYSTSDSCMTTSTLTEYFCSGSTQTSQLVGCGTDVAFDTCIGGDVYTNSTDFFCGSGACSSSNSVTLKEVCGYGCSGGACSPPLAQPDLVVSNILFTETQQTPSNGSNSSVSVYVYTTVQNVGNAPTGTSFDVRTVGINTIGFGFPALSPGASYQVSESYECLYGHTYTATADWYNVVAESNEANNVNNVFIDCIV